jgi:glycosyltransferase involved in cell wall biosynthesis
MPGGADRIVADILPRLDPATYQLVLACLCKPREVERQTWSSLAESSIAVNEFPGGRIFDLRQFRAIKQLVSREKVRLLHCHDPKSYMYSYLMKRIRPSLLTVAHIHGWAAPSTRFAFYTLLSRFFLRRMDALVAVSEAVGGRLPKLGPARLQIIHNGIDLEAWRPGSAVGPESGDSETGRYQVSFVGRLSPEKCPLDFVRTAQKLHLSGAPFSFIVAGTGRLLDEMRELVARVGLSSRFSFLGYVDQERLVRLYREVDAILLTSRDEGLPMAVLEAMAMGVNVVSTQVGGVPEAVIHGQTGLLAEFGDLASLSRHIIALRDNPAMATRLRERARQHVASNFSLQATVDKVAALYEDLLDRRM